MGAEVTVHTQAPPKAKEKSKSSVRSQKKYDAKPKISALAAQQDSETKTTKLEIAETEKPKSPTNLPRWFVAPGSSSGTEAAEVKTKGPSQYKRDEAEFEITLPRSSDKAETFMSYPSKQNHLLQALRQVENLYTSPITTLLPPEQYLRQRPGGILGAGMVLKSDSVPGLIHELDVMVYGAPNFRVIPDCPIYGVGQATRSGIRGVLNFFQKNRTYWINLREEPVIYVNNRPFVLREHDFPFRNMVDFQGIDARRLAQIEDRLKEDILAEAEQFGGNILVHTEIKNKELRPAWCSVSPDSVMTSAQVYSNLKAEGYDVTYVRVPVTAESSFTPAHFDTIVQTYVEAIKKDPGSRFIFNCQMGIGRSTMGMLTVYLLHEQLRHLIASSDPNRPKRTLERKLSTNMPGEPVEEGTRLEQYRNGDYQCVNKLVRLVADSRDAKERVDRGIDACSRVYHVRDVIVEAFVKADQESDEPKHKAYVDSALDALRRYFWLICFASYLPGYLKATFGNLLRGPNVLPPMKTLKLQRSSSETDIGASSFGEWIDKIPSLWTLSDSILKTEFSDQTPPPLAMDSLSKEDRFVWSRAGTVLGKFNIIKLERVWNQSKLDEQRGTPFFRTLEDLPLSAGGQPTLAGIRNILDELQQSIGKKGTVIWINLREEPTLYIQGHAAFLRDVRRPFAGLKEFKAGMTPKRAVQLENRLKAEILEELAQNEGKLLLHVEEPDSAHTIKTQWRSLSPSDIQTSTELFEALKTSGYNVAYYTIPLHVAEVPGLASIDRVLDALAGVSSRDHVVFNCQSGSRRSTMGLAIGYLLAFHKGDADLRVPTEHKRARSVSPVKYAPRSSSALMLKSPSGSSLAGHRQNRSQADVSPVASDTEQLDPKEGVHDSREYRGILKLIRCMKKGRQMKWETDNIIEECSSVLHLRESIALAQREAEDTRHTSETSLLSALTYMESYAYLICVNGYLTDRFETQRKGGMSKDFPSFSGWIASRKELVLALEAIRKNPERSLLVNTLSLDSAHAEVFEMRDWSVLIHGSLLKFDYFPGCRSNKINQIVKGSTNFRLLSTFPVGGCAIPTKQGIQNILAYVFGAHAYLEAENVLSEPIYPPFHADAVIWCNLREEPLIYINGKPFVLRDIDQPLDNLIQTGINGYRLEGMEKQLKYDVTRESAKWQGHFLVHDEDETGALLAHWEPIGPGSIKTPQEIFTEVCATIQPKKAIAQQRAFYRRTPITDEQAPTPEAVDDLLQTLECEDHRDFPRRVILMNCQMGRGRTTTGMVIACLWTMHRGTKPISTYVPDEEEVVTQNDVIELSDDKAKRLKHGWYKVVGKLVRLLVKGRELKMELDRVIDECAALQNLRTAIYENVVHGEGALDRKRDFFMHRARDYLQRYCFLLVINSYLRKRQNKIFSQWLSDQPEIVHLLATIEPV